MSLLNGTVYTSIRHFTEFYWNYATHSVRVCVSSKSINPNLPFTKKVISRLNLFLKRWLVCTTFSAIIPLYLRIHSLKNYSLIFLHVSTLIYSVILSTNTPRKTNQSNHSIPQSLHFILIVQPTFPKYFSIVLPFFYATPNFYNEDQHPTVKKGRRELKDSRRPEGGSEGLIVPETRPTRRAAPTAPAFPGQSRRGTAGATAGA